MIGSKDLSEISGVSFNSTAALSRNVITLHMHGQKEKATGTQARVHLWKKETRPFQSIVCKQRATPRHAALLWRQSPTYCCSSYTREEGAFFNTCTELLLLLLGVYSFKVHQSESCRLEFTQGSTFPKGQLKKKTRVFKSSLFSFFLPKNGGSKK